MSVSAITSSLLHPPQMQSLQPSGSGFAALASSLSGSSSASSLSSLLSGASAATSSPAPATITSTQPLLMSELTALGTQLQAGNLSGAQQAYSTLEKDLNATGSQGPGHFHGHSGHPRPVYSADANTMSSSPATTTSSVGGPPTVIA